MSGHSYGITCPNCDGTADCYSDHKPFDLIIIQCDECGLVIHPTVTYIGLEELNSSRVDQELEPLTKLPEQRTDVY